MSLAQAVLNVLRDPPPDFVFEVAVDGIAVSRTRPPATVQQVALRPGVIAPSPVRENILDPGALAEAVRNLLSNAGSRGKRKAAVILPDNCVRIAVLDFDTLPDKEDERRPLINFRLRKSVPFDIDEAALAYFPQPGNKVIVALAPAGIVAHYEAPFRAAGLHPGLVTVSSLAIIDLLPSTGSIALAHRSPGALTVLGLNKGIVTIARTLEMGEHESPEDAAGAARTVVAETDPLDEIVAAIYPTLAWIEDNEGSRPSMLYMSGFGATTDSSRIRLSAELEIEVTAIHDPFPGLSGYLSSISPAASAQASRKVAA